MDRKPNYLSKQLVGVGIIGLVLLWSSPQLAGSLSMLLRLRFRSVYKELHADRETGC